MTVALENARLFDETQRLFKAEQQRAAELAIITSVQQALAAELNMQGIYDAVGDKIREIFHQADLGIRIYDPQTNLIHYPYVYEDGKRIEIDSDAASATRDSPRTSCARAKRSSSTRTCARQDEKYGSYTLPGTQDEKSAIYVPLVVGRPGARADQPHRHGARARVQRIRRAPAADARQQHERRARERAPLRRDAAPVQGERAARRRARDHQQRAAGARRRAQHAGDLRRRRRQDPRDLPQHGHGHPHLRPADAI